MADARLSVEVGAKLDQLNAGFANAVKIVESGATQLDNSSKKVERSFKLLNDTKFTFGANFQTASQKLALDAMKTGAALGGSLKKGSDQAAFALTNLGRVAQDAPFGFIGIQNNLNPLLESFARLITETGSNGAALKALGSSLIGPAGLGIALSLVSAGVLLYQEYQRKANKATEDAKKTTEDYAKTLSAVNQASLVGSQNIQGDIVKLQSLYAITQDSTVSLKQRKEAVDELQEQYPAYFKNITDEAFLAGAAKSAYDRLTTAIIATGKARAAESLIAENSKKVLENEQKLIDIRARRLIIDKELSATNNQKLTGGSEESLQGELAQIDAKRNRLQDERNEGIRIANELSGDSYKINQNNLQLTKSIVDQVKKGADLVGGVGDIAKVPTPKKESTKERLQERGLSITKVAEEFKNASVIISDNGDLIAKGIQNAQDKINGIDLAIAMKKFNDFNEQISVILNEGLISGLSDIGASIGDAISSGSNALEAAGGALLGTLGGVLMQLGQLAIETGIGIKAIKTSLETLNPVVAVAAGVALVALGAFVKGKASSIGDGGSSNSGSQRKRIPGFANGTDSAPGGLAWVGERGPEIMQVPKGASITPNHDLKGLGGSTNINLAGKLRVGMRELIFEIDKERSLQRRSG